jgi:hypothetical protein
VLGVCAAEGDFVDDKENLLNIQFSFLGATALRVTFAALPLRKSPPSGALNTE